MGMFSSGSSKIEGKLVHVNAWRDISDLTSVDGNLVGQHAWCWDLDGIRPVVVVVTKSVGEVEDSILGDQGGVLGDIEMSGLHGSLGNLMGHEEEIEFAVDDFWLLNEPSINISTLRWVENLSLWMAWASSLLKESLSNSLVDNNEGNVR